MRHSRGFTLVELMVTMAVGGLLVVAAVGMYLTVLGQSPVIKTRNTLSTNLQSALNRINDDVRRSSNVSLYNIEPDANAPQNLTGYENVPGPDPDSNDQYYWRMGENRLLLNQTPLDSSSNPIYDNAQYAVGKKNTIIYYVNNGALYRRVVAASYGSNSVATAGCARVATGGCVNSDIKLVDNLKPSLGNAAFKVTYYDKNGNPIGYTVDTASGPVPSYSGFPLARSIGVTIELESGEVVGGQKISLSNTARMQFRSGVNVVPPAVVNPPYVPPTNGLGDPGLMAGPGGLYMFGSTIQGGDVYVKGKLTMSLISTMGGVGLWGTGNGVPANLNVGNIACGSGATYPQPCGTSSPPITMDTFFANIYGNVCARDQVNPARISPYGSATQGLIVGCVPPDADLPIFDKSAFTTGMTNGVAPGASASCTGGSTTLQANRTYTGNVNLDLYCKGVINGNVYVTGNFQMVNGAQLKVAESAGRVRPIVVVNGKINTFNGASIIPNSYGTTPYFISFYSADSACSNSPTCNSITPAMLKQTLDNYSSGASPVFVSITTAPGSSFYSYFGESAIGIFTTIGAVAGQRINMDQAANVVLDGSL